jgi:hypothetical protein
MLLAFFEALGGARVSLSNNSAADFDTSLATATLAISSDGTVSGTGNVSSFSANWITPTSAAGANYDVRVQVLSGNTPSGSSLNTWLPLSSNYFWTLSQSGIGFLTSELGMEIRSAASGQVLASATYTVSATVEV